MILNLQSRLCDCDRLVLTDEPPLLMHSNLSFRLNVEAMEVYLW